MTLAKVLMTGTMEQVLIGLDDIRIRTRDRQAVLEKPVQNDTFQGKNVLPDGVDGLDDIKGQVKPDGWGRIKNAELICVNTVKNIYQLSSESIQSIAAIYDSGVLLSRGVQVVSVTDLLSTAPQIGQYNFVLSDVKGAFIRLSSAPSGRITSDFDGITRFTGWPSSASQIMRDILLSRSTLTADDLCEADFSAIHALRPWVCGLYVSEDSSIPDLLDALATSCGCWWGFDRLGKVRIKPVMTPSGNPEVTFRTFDGSAVRDTDSDIISLDISATRDQGRGIPYWRVRVGYDRCWTVQSSSDLAAAADRQIDFTGQDYRYVEKSDSEIKYLHPSSSDLLVQTLITASGDAESLASDLSGLYGQRRQIVKVTAEMSARIADKIDLGTVVSIKINRFGWDSGKSFLSYARNWVTPVSGGVL